MGKIKKKDVKKTEKLSVEATEETGSKLSSVSVTSTDEPASPTITTTPNTEPVKQDEPLATAAATESLEEPVLNQLIVAKYEGELVNGLYEGEGVAYYKDGNVYRGMFSEGFMHGKGTYTWTDGLMYEGEFSMNCPMGYGVYIWPNGSRYEGQVYKGLRHGTGIYVASDQNVSYVGEWHKGIRHGKGTIFYNAEGTSWYEGEWKHKTKEGWGVQCFMSGNIYEGEWKNNKFHGMGRMKWLSSNEEYKGQWENGIQNGLGTHTWFLKRVPGSQYSLRNEYVGNFVDGVRHGQGRYYYANGAMYDGEWKTNKKHGMGKFIFKNGKIYVGEFVEDQISEYPNFKYDRVNTPDLSGIRTQSPACGENLDASTFNSGISSLSGSYIELDLTSLLNLFPENERLEELKQVEYGVLRNLTMLRRMYKFYSSLGNENCFDNAFLMTKLQFWRFLKDCKFHHYKLTLSEMDRFLTGTADPEEVHSPFATMLIRTFLTHIIYLAYHITHTQNLEKKFSIVDCFSNIMAQNISPHASHIKGFLLLDEHKTEHAMSYIDKSWDIYKIYCRKNSSPPYEPTMTMRHFIWMMKDLKIINNKLSVTKIVDILADDDPCVRDGNEINLELELTFLEFFEALFGCATVYVTDDLLKETANGLQGEQTERPAMDSSADPAEHCTTPSQSHKSEYETEEQLLISNLKANGKCSPPVSLHTPKKVQKEVTTADKWFNQINVFFEKIFFPAYEKVEQLKAEIPQNRMRQAELTRLQQIREEEEARLKALKAEEEAKKIAQMELEKVRIEAVPISVDQADDTKSEQQPITPKHEPSMPPSTASTKTPPATGKKKKR
ncbi:radial spoke head 10 homolog B isoform X2 [Pseudophryne corroboree]|uniref:radial spoke head 10 homolog B isoform X2 n=1 Tax=Pseudophryne corroboree TaxID=495146 RepID=UPI003081723D